MTYGSKRVLIVLVFSVPFFFSVIVISVSVARNAIYDHTYLNLMSSIIAAYSVPIGSLIFGMLGKIKYEPKKEISTGQFITVLIFVVAWNVVFIFPFFVYLFSDSFDAVSVKNQIVFMSQPISYLLISCPLSFFFSR